jgi:hypothetical protein
MSGLACHLNIGSLAKCLKKLMGRPLVKHQLRRKLHQDYPELGAEPLNFIDKAIQDGRVR